MKTLYDHIDMAAKFVPGTALQESEQKRVDEATSVGLEMARRMASAKKEEPTPVQLPSMPIPN